MAFTTVTSCGSDPHSHHQGGRKHERESSKFDGSLKRESPRNCHCYTMGVEKKSQNVDRNWKSLKSQILRAQNSRFKYTSIRKKQKRELSSVYERNGHVDCICWLIQSRISSRDEVIYCPSENSGLGFRSLELFNNALGWIAESLGKHISWHDLNRPLKKALKVASRPDNKTIFEMGWYALFYHSMTTLNKRSSSR